jgi:hypothetical protein
MNRSALKPLHVELETKMTIIFKTSQICLIKFHLFVEVPSQMNRFSCVGDKREDGEWIPVVRSREHVPRYSVYTDCGLILPYMK